jgi:predicted nucleotidyltransferase
MSEVFNFIRMTYLHYLEDDVVFLALGGSLGRGNYIHGWSDADLFLVLSRTDAETLHRVKACEEEIEKRFQIEVDTMIMSKKTLEYTPAKMLHGKIKNFLFFIDRTKVLVYKDIKLPFVGFSDFIYGFWATYADQEKNYLRRNADVNYDNRKSLEKLLKKNIKIIFLLLKQCFAREDFAPCTYDEVLVLTQGKISKKIQIKIQEYVTFRKNNVIPTLTDDILKQEIGVSVDIFSDLGEIMVRSLDGNI